MGRRGNPGVRLGAHPRRCGEHQVEKPVAPTAKGSSPQVRGTLTGGVEPTGTDGLIPAGAGNIGSGSKTTRSPKAHPRRCGEHDPVAGLGTSGMGSSPQVRGTSPRRPQHRRPQGLIPEVRGTFQSRGPQGGPRRLIPAGAGNIVLAGAYVLECPGSSPQVRGTSRRRCGGASR